MSRIDRVETFHFVEKLPRAFGPSPILYDSLDTIIVKLATDDGLVGWGEALAIGGSRALIDAELTPRLIGENPIDTRRLWQTLWGPNFGNSFAVAGLDLALHDLRGKILGLSLGQLYGGAFHTRVPAYASGVSYVEGLTPEEHWVADALAMVERGFHAIKVRIGRFPPTRELPILADMRRALPDGIALMVDANTAYTVPTAIRVGRQLEDLGVAWYEEPLHQADYAGYAELTRTLDIQIAGGEALRDRSAFHDLIGRRSVDIVQPDVSICGGVAEWLFVADLARLARIPCAPHCYSSGIVIAASAHLLSLQPEPTAVAGNDLPPLEIAVAPPAVQDTIAYQDRLLTKPFRPVDGWVDVPTAPGLGIDIDEDVLRAYSRP